MVLYGAGWIINLGWHRYCILYQRTLSLLILHIFPQYTKLICIQTNVKAILISIIIVEDHPGDGHTWPKHLGVMTHQMMSVGVVTHQMMSPKSVFLLKVTATKTQT